MRVAFYGRFSKESQNEASIRQQFQIVRDWCQRNGHQIVAVYRDRGWSGENTHRPDFQRLLKDARRGKFDLIVTHKLNRFSRNLVDVILTIHMLQELDPKVLYASATEIFDCTSMIGRVLLILLAFFAEWYLVELSAETKRGKHDRFANKKLQNNLPPFGYIYAGKDSPPMLDQTVKTTATDPQAATPALALKTAFFMRLTDRFTQRMIQTHEITRERVRSLYTDADCARWLNSQGYRTKKSNLFMADSIGDIFRNPFLAGWIKEVGYAEGRTKAGKKKRKSRAAPDLIRGIHPPLVSQEAFDLMQQVRAVAATNPNGKSARIDRVYWLDEGLAICSDCGRPLNCHAVYDRQGALAYYCGSHKRGGECPAKKSFVRQSLIEPQIQQLMASLALPEVLELRIAELLDSDQENVRLAEEIAQLHDEADRLDAKLDVGRIDAKTYKAKIQVLTDTISRLQFKREQADATGIEIAFDEFKGLVTLWETADEEEKRDVLHALLHCVRVNVTTKEAVAFKPKLGFVPMFTASSELQNAGEGWFLIKQNGLTAVDSETVDTEATGFESS